MIHLAEFLMILFDTLMVFTLIPMWISLFSRMRTIEKNVAILQRVENLLITNFNHLERMEKLYYDEEPIRERQLYSD